VVVLPDPFGPRNPVRYENRYYVGGTYGVGGGSRDERSWNPLLRTALRSAVTASLYDSTSLYDTPVRQEARWPHLYYSSAYPTTPSPG